MEIATSHPPSSLARLMSPAIRCCRFDSVPDHSNPHFTARLWNTFGPFGEEFEFINNSWDIAAWLSSRDGNVPFTYKMRTNT